MDMGNVNFKKSFGLFLVVGKTHILAVSGVSWKGL